MVKFLALLLLAVAALLAAPGARAATTCTVTSITALNFGQVNPTTGTVDSTATINYSCTYTGGALGGLYGDYITMCFSLAPDATSGLYTPRGMVDGSNDTMAYNLYADAARSTVFGSNNSGTYLPVVVNRNITLLSTSIVINGSVTVYGRVVSPQATLSPGSYAGILPGSLSGNFLTFRYSEALLAIGTYPTCNAGGTNGGNVAAPALNVSATVVPACVLATATDLNFGSVAGLLNTATDQTSLLRMTCTNRAAWQVGLDNGQNASGTTRRMKNGTSYVTYELYKTAARAIGDRWGNTLNTDTATGSGNGAQQTLTVYGRVPVQTPKAAGAYTDTITVLVTY